MNLISPQGLIFTLLLLFLAVQLVVSVFVLVDILKSEFKGNDKIIWVLVILFLWIFGAILYFFIGRKQKIK